jgi:Rad4 beta-hairpin domain 3
MHMTTESATSALDDLRTAYGNIDCTKPLPLTVTRVTEPRVQTLLRKLNVRYLPAYVGYDGYGRQFYARYGGVVIAASELPQVEAAIAERRRRKERQEARQQARLDLARFGDAMAIVGLLSSVVGMSLDEHIQLAVECLHAANRAGKHAAHLHQRSAIYAAKDVFLSAMIRVNRATVGTFEIEQTGRRQVCTVCGRDWMGGSYCYGCEGDSGESVSELRRWYIVDCGSGYRFHQPSLDADIAARALPIEPHDPTQEPRNIPTVRFGDDRVLDVDMQLTIVRAAAQRLGIAHLEGLQ